MDINTRRKTKSDPSTNFNSKSGFSNKVNEQENKQSIFKDCSFVLNTNNNILYYVLHSQNVIQVTGNPKNTFPPISTVKDLVSDYCIIKDKKQAFKIIIKELDLLQEQMGLLKNFLAYYNT